ncbi:DUF6907 domain-containing protein [Nocardia tengchongensis]|uniref:DUF6907 domain-containing protein n=1 Tax=Nocardia tengchongensis TaxID=2055889 RepID=UPI0036B264A2
MKFHTFGTSIVACATVRGDTASLWSDALDQCPPWCCRHAPPDPSAPGDGLIHFGVDRRVTLSDGADADSDVHVTVRAWATGNSRDRQVCTRLDAGDARVLDLTVRQTRHLARMLIEFADRRSTFEGAAGGSCPYWCVDHTRSTPARSRAAIVVHYSEIRTMSAHSPDRARSREISIQLVAVDGGGPTPQLRLYLAVSMELIDLTASEACRLAAALFEAAEDCDRSGA